jgi:hypothetical protein
MDRVGGRQHHGSPIFLEDDQPHPVPALVGIGQQRKDGPFRSSHTFGDGHGPGSINHEKHQVSGSLHPYLALKISRLNGKSHTLALFVTPLLVWGSSTEGGIKG